MYKRLLLAGLFLSCAVVQARGYYHVTQLPDTAQAQNLTQDGHVLGFDSISGIATLWDSKTGITGIPAPDGKKWSRLVISPGGRLLGELTDLGYTPSYLQGLLGTPLQPVVWPEFAPPAPSSGGSSGNISICNGAFDLCSVLDFQAPPIPPSPPIYYARVINDGGTIAGRILSGQIPGNTLGLSTWYAMRYGINGHIEVLPDPFNEALSINNRGDVLVGPAFNLWGLAGKVTLWMNDGQQYSPDLLPGFSIFSVNQIRLNDLGQIAGTMTNQETSPATNSTAESIFHSYLWTPGYGTMALEQLAGYKNSFVLGLNNDGISVGLASNYGLACCIWSTLVDYNSAVVWQPDGRVVDLNTVLDKKHLQRNTDLAWLTDAIAINDAGQILASGIDNSGAFHTYLLQPRYTRDHDNVEDNNIENSPEGDVKE